MASDSAEHVHTIPELPARPDDGHKGTFGRVLIVAGSRGMSGAACLSGYGALRGGAGLVTLAVPNCITNIVAAVEPCWMTLGLSTDHDDPRDSSIQSLESAWTGKSSVAIGPGLGGSDAVSSLVRHAIQQCPAPLVVDADALNAIAPEFPKDAECEFDFPSTAPRIFTPHPGEFSRLTGLSVPEIQSNRESISMDFARQHGITLLLKGAGTVITDGEKIAINSTGNSGMATGGSGDVLTGLITALLAQKMDPFDAALLGAHVHGLAGDIAARTHSARGMTASDLHRSIGLAWQALESQRG